MGTNAPSIKVKKITGTTSSTQGGSVDEIHGLNASKIISITALVQFSGNSYVPPTYNQVANYEFNWYSDDTKIYILLKAGNSFIWYHSIGQQVGNVNLTLLLDQI